MLCNFDNPEFCKLIQLFFNAFNKYTMMEKKPKDFGTGDLLYHAEVHTLIAIRDNPEINITKLAKETGVTKGAVSQTVNRLGNKQMIARYKGENDREVNLRLSDKGVIACEKHTKYMESLFRVYEEMYLSASPKERKAVKKVIETINEQFDNYLQNIY